MGETMAHVVATGAGKAMMERRNDPTHDYILALTGKPRPRVLFVGTRRETTRRTS
jgi:hypothetical protein